MVPGYPAAGRVCTWLGVPGPGLHAQFTWHSNMFQVQTLTHPIMRPGFARFHPQFWSATIIPYFVPQLSIWVLIVSQYDPCMNDAVSGALLPPGLRFAIWWIFVELLGNYAENRVLSKATRQISIQIQIGDLEVKMCLGLHLAQIDYIAVRSELRYFIGEKAFAAEPCETHW
jgi:hypothetical protein